MKGFSVKDYSLLAAVVLVLGVISLHSTQVEGKNVLGLFTSHSPSHLIVHMSIAKALAERGHNVTVVCSMKPAITHENITLIIIPLPAEDEKKLNQQMATMASKQNSLFSTMVSLMGSMKSLTDFQYDTLRDKRFTAFVERQDTKFDFMILGAFLNDFELAVAAKFKCPVAVSWPGSPMALINDYVGNPDETAYVPNLNIVTKDGKPMSFTERVINTITSSFFSVVKFVLDLRMNDYYNKLLENDKSNLPTLKEMRRNISLVFCNSASLSEGPIRPNVPALVEIGGIQVKDKPNPLPEDIGKFLNSSKQHGAILFSLGSNVKGEHIKPEIVQYIFNVLSKLKQNVIWKWENLERTPGKSANILYKKWLPQDDILAHPNLKLFITHAGKGGIVESQYHGVPMIALPVFGDQMSNAEKMSKSGFGLHLNLLDLNEKEFSEALTEVLNNETYAKEVKKYSQVYRDRPMTARESVIYWSEYVMSYHGAPHIQSPLKHMNFIQSRNLDVLAFFCLIFFGIWKLLKLTFKLVAKKFCKNCQKGKKSKPEKKVKKQ